MEPSTANEQRFGTAEEPAPHPQNAAVATANPAPPSRISNRQRFRVMFVAWSLLLAISFNLFAFSKRRVLFTTLNPTPQLFAGSDDEALIAHHITTLVDREPPWYLLPSERAHYRKLIFFSYAFNRFFNKSELNLELRYSADLHTRSLAGSGFSKIERGDDAILSEIPHTQVLAGYHSPTFESQQLKQRASAAAANLLNQPRPRPYP